MTAVKHITLTVVVATLAVLFAVAWTIGQVVTAVRGVSKP